MKMNLLKASSLVMAMIIAVMLALTGCSVSNESGMKEKQDDNLIISNVNKYFSFDSYWGPYYDWSGRIQVAYFLKSSYGYQNAVTTTVPDDFVCIGGGAFCEYDGYPGFITGSWPENTLRSWIAQSRDHIYSGYHRLTSVAVGIRLIGNNGNFIPAEEVKKHFTIRGKVGAFDNLRAVATQTGLYNNTVSGGVYMPGSIGGNISQLLTDCYLSNNVWLNYSKSHIQYSTNQLHAYVIDYDGKEIQNFGYLNVNNKSVIVNYEGSRRGVTLPPTQGWIISGVGGRTSVYLPDITTGRFLTQMGIYNFPSGINAVVADSDLIYPLTGTNLTVQVMEIQKRP